MPDDELPGILTLTDLNGKIETTEIESVLVVLTDSLGRLIGRHVPALHFLEQVARHGLHLPADFLSPGAPALHCRIDVNSLRPAPWLNRSAIVFASIDRGAGAESRVFTPRDLLVEQLTKTAEMGLRARVSATINYYIFGEPPAILRARDFTALTPVDGQHVAGDMVSASNAELVNEGARRSLAAAGIAPAYTQPTGSPGHYEAAMPSRDALTTADGLVLLKFCLKSFARQFGNSVTFMALPMAQRPGSALTLRLSLWSRDGRRNIFADSEPEPAEEAGAEASSVPSYSDLEPETGLELEEAPVQEGSYHATGDERAQFSTGIRMHLPGILPFLVPTANSYKRLQQTSGQSRLHEMVSAGDEAGRLQSAYVQCSIAGADANPYLAVAALLAAGLKGICGELPAAGSEAPDSFAEALGIMRGDPAAAGLLGDETLQQLYAVWEGERRLLEQQVTDWEKIRYFEQA
jgi:glutamine synthetase